MTAWEKCVAYHGHICGGITIGYRAALYAMDLMDVLEGDDSLVCVAQSKTCAVDAIRVLLGCTEEKENLKFRVTGLPVFSFLNRDTGETLCLSLKPTPEGMTKEQSFRYFQNTNEEDLFETVPVCPEDLALLQG